MPSKDIFLTVAYLAALFSNGKGMLEKIINNSWMVRIPWATRFSWAV